MLAKPFEKHGNKSFLEDKLHGLNDEEFNRRMVCLLETSLEKRV